MFPDSDKKKINMLYITINVCERTNGFRPSRSNSLTIKSKLYTRGSSETQSDFCMCTYINRYPWKKKNCVTTQWLWESF